jgi:hypothetical protein
MRLELLPLAVTAVYLFSILLPPAALKVSYPVSPGLDHQGVLAASCQLFACIVPVYSLSRTLSDAMKESCVLIAYCHNYMHTYAK